MAEHDITINDKTTTKPNYEKKFVLYLSESKGYLKRKFNHQINIATDIREAMTFPAESLAKSYAERHGLVRYQVRAAYLDGK